MADTRRWTVRILMVLAFALPLSLVALYFINPFGARSADPRERILGVGLYRMPAESMTPTFAVGDLIFVRSGYYNQTPPQRGDLATFISREPAGEIWVKRIIGLPGETVAIRAGRVHIDGRALEEPYVLPANAATEYSREMPATAVPADAYFVLGDNRDNSSDSRLWGFVGRDELAGKVVGR